MSVQRENNGTAGTAGATAAPQQQQQQTENRQGFNFGGGNTQGERRRNSMSFADIGSMLQAPMGRNPQGEILSKFSEALTAAFPAKMNLIPTVVPIDHNLVGSLRYSVIVLAFQQDTAKDIVAYHTLILAGTSEAMVTQYEVTAGRNVEILRPASDAWDAVLIDVVLDQLKRQFPGARFVCADGEVIPESFDYTNAELVYGVAANSLLAGLTVLQTSKEDFEDLNISKFNNDATLSVRTSFARKEYFDSTDLPVRSDVQVDLLSVQARNTNSQSLNNGGDQQRLLAGISGFADLIYDPVNPTNNLYAMNQPQSYLKYSPRFVITALEPNSIMTSGIQLLSLATIASLRENNNWVNAFRPKALLGKGKDGKANRDMHDIGAVGIEANMDNNPSGFGTIIDTKSDSFVAGNFFGNLVVNTIRKDLIISMDVAECGPATWYNGIFAALARGSENAYKELYNAAMQLTNGVFQEFFPYGNAILLDDNNRIHLGYYVDQDGVRRDIRDLDYLAVANIIGEQDPQQLRIWSDSFVRIEFPLNERLFERKKLIEKLLPNPVFTGYARRFTFHIAFIDALLASFKKLNLSMQTIGTYLDTGSLDRPTGGFLSNTTQGGMGVTGVFNRNQGYFGGAGGQFGNGFSRWGN